MIPSRLSLQIQYLSVKTTLGTFQAIAAYMELAIVAEAIFSISLT